MCFGQADANIIGGAQMYFGEKLQSGAITYSGGAQLYSSGAKPVEYSP